MKKTFFLTFCLLLFLGSSGQAQENYLDEYLNHLFQNKKMMGNVSISLHDTIIYTHSTGFSNVEKKIKNTSETKFRIGSLTKTYTATLVMMAVEEGKLSLDTPLATFFPEVAHAKNITLEDMLLHRSGIFNFTEIDKGIDWEQKAHTEKEILRYIQKPKSQFVPGSAFEYSNTNYLLLGFILEKTYQKSYNTLIQEKIAQPLGLHNTYFSAQTDNTKKEALSYNIQNHFITNAKVNFYNHQSSGGLVATASEVNLFLTALFNGKLLNKESLQQLLPKQKGTYGFGIEKLNFTDTEVYEHSGRIENYFSEYRYFPNEKLGIVILTNALNINLNEVQTFIVQFLYNLNPKLPKFNATVDLSAEAFQAIGGTYQETNKKYTVTISSDGKNLIFQNSDTGQMFVPLTYKGPLHFEYNNMSVQFVPEQHKMLLQQNGVQETYIQLKL